MRNENPLVSQCVDVLRQGLALLNELDDNVYAETRCLPVPSGVGGHFRHCLDFYNRFLEGVRTGRIDYNCRERDPLVERDRSLAITNVQLVIAGLESLPVMDGSRPVLVALEGAASEAPWCESTVLRELQFLLSHTTHHYALIALLLRLQGFEPDAEFGVNSSTLQHWKTGDRLFLSRPSLVFDRTY